MFSIIKKYNFFTEKLFIDSLSKNKKKYFNNYLAKKFFFKLFFFNKIYTCFGIY